MLERAPNVRFGDCLCKDAGNLALSVNVLQFNATFLGQAKEPIYCHSMCTTHMLQRCASTFQADLNYGLVVFGNDEVAFCALKAF